MFTSAQVEVQLVRQLLDACGSLRPEHDAPAGKRKSTDHCPSGHIFKQYYPGSTIHPGKTHERTHHLRPARRRRRTSPHQCRLACRRLAATPRGWGDGDFSLTGRKMPSSPGTSRAAASSTLPGHCGAQHRHVHPKCRPPSPRSCSAFTHSCYQVVPLCRVRDAGRAHQCHRSHQRPAKTAFFPPGPRR